MRIGVDQVLYCSNWGEKGIATHLSFLPKNNNLLNNGVEISTPGHPLEFLLNCSTFN